jgi:hypothetical protein
MSVQNPTRVGSTFHEAPEAVWEVLVEILFDPELSAAEIRKVQAELWTRLHDAITGVVGEHAYDGVDPEITVLRGRGEETPLFPMVVGDSRFTCTLDMVEVAERLARTTDLRHIAYDASGRAYELALEINFLRRPQLDGGRAAEMPEPRKVEQVRKRRTKRKS